MKAQIKYWGVRGSVPAPLTKAQVLAKEEALIKRIIDDNAMEELKKSPEKIKDYLQSLPLSLSGTYGGNTTCLELRVEDSPLIVIDMGTGARDLGNYLLGRLFKGEHLNPLSSDEKTKNELHIFLTHYHWDHLQGFPFFGPAFVGLNGKRLNIHFYGKKDARKTLSEVLAGQQEYPNFPVVWEDMPCKKEYHELERLVKEEITVGKTKIKYQELTHPDAMFAYRIDVDGNGFVCATDTEHKNCPDPRLVALAKNAKILYYDGQYTPEEYEGKVGMPKVDWGHSTYEWGIRNALAANVETVVIGHHEPARDDFGIESVLVRANKFRDEQLALPENKDKKLNVVMAYDGMEQEL
jgi:phosphoribosyl 1,2-cyclic phosphodiesterase